METKIFEVCVPEFNKEIFIVAYASYITKWCEGYYNNTIFTMSAPQSIYDEIANLKEECIDII